eukprot:CAMPEP_0194257098 /NCGR_PEP_ID=MMETSP0158-20130606/38248_1 /TAXON_ID=33649 /ORGANISM="Thalassionema nitzschioides, Strain L26-B" /LENGTH=414 /DNA_ID=CAMNT_0038996033 /DNA_START=21 /DNA_END=1261 /DNA_ORIENTATION=-
MKQQQQKQRQRVMMWVLLLVFLCFDKTLASSKVANKTGRKALPGRPNIRISNNNVQPSPPKQLPQQQQQQPPPSSNKKIMTIPAMLEDLSHLKKLNNNDNEKIPLLLTPTNWKRDSSYTKSWTKQDWEHHQVDSFQRYARHLIKWFISPTARSVLPAVGGFVVWSFLVVTFLGKYPALAEKATFLPGLSSFTAPLSLLLALKTNRALNRLLETRSVWGKMISNTKSLAQLTAIYMHPKSSETAVLMGRYLALYLWFMKGYFRDEDAGEVMQRILPEEEYSWLQQAATNNSDTTPLPTAAVFRLRQLMASEIDKLPRTAQMAMEDRLWHLESMFGTLKRILGSPIPPTYTRHTSRVLCLFLGLLPIALVGNHISPGTIYVTVALLAYVFVGIDEIGVEIEHPFPLIPMFYLARAA